MVQWSVTIALPRAVVLLGTTPNLGTNTGANTSPDTSSNSTCADTAADTCPAADTHAAC